MGRERYVSKIDLGSSHGWGCRCQTQLGISITYGRSVGLGDGQFSVKEAPCCGMGRWEPQHLYTLLHVGGLEDGKWVSKEKLHLAQVYVSLWFGVLSIDGIFFLNRHWPCGTGTIFGTPLITNLHLHYTFTLPSLHEDRQWDGNT